MEKIIINMDLGKALLNFRSKDKNRIGLSNILFTENGEVCATDGKRLILIKKDKHNINILPGVYKVLSSGKEGKYFMFLCIEKTEDQFPDITKVLKDNVPCIKEDDGKDLMAIIDDGNLRIYGKLYKLFHKTGKAVNPEMAAEFPKNEGFSIHTDDKEGGAIEFHGTGIKALFMPFRVN